MANVYVGNDRATKVEKPKGHTVTLDNTQGAVDIYYDSDYNALNTAAPGSIPNGTKLAAGAQQVVQDWDLPLYFRAASNTTMKVQP